MKKHTIIWVLLIGIHHAFAQGFVNLDFESANLSGYSAGSVPATDAIPGWTAYIGGMSLTNITYDASENQLEVDIIGSTNIQDNYYIYLGGSFNDPASIGQTGTIPITAQSIIFSGNLLFADTVSFNDQRLSVSVIGTGSDYAIYAANISAFAGQTGQLLFTSSHLPVSTGDTIDNIQFSSSPVPEPSSSSLLLLGSGVFIYVRRVFHR
jgi:hypothetical protein